MAAEEITFEPFSSEEQYPRIMQLVEKDLSEPYSIFTYRYFINSWPNLCHLAFCQNEIIGVVICKVEKHRLFKRGYLGMLAVEQSYRKKGIGSTLVRRAITAMREDGCEEVVLETELSNSGALRLYENLGFFRDKYLNRYYLNGGDACRLKLWFKDVDYYKHLYEPGDADDDEQ